MPKLTPCPRPDCTPRHGDEQTMTTPDLAELRRLLDVNRERGFHALPWHAWDRGIGYELHVGATCRDEMEPRGYCEEVNNGFRETFGAPEAELIVAAVNALPTLLDVAAERDALAAKVERVRDWLDHRGVDVSDRDGAYMDGYRAAQRHAFTDAAELRAALDGAES